MVPESLNGLSLTTVDGVWLSPHGPLLLVPANN